MSASPGKLCTALRNDALRRHEEAGAILAGRGRLTERDVHQLRVISKRLRAAWQVLLPVLKDPGLAREASGELAGAARPLREAREFHATGAALEALARQARKKEARRVFVDAHERLFASLPAQVKQPARNAALREPFARDLARWQALELKVGDGRLCRQGVGRIYRKAWKRAVAAERTGDVKLWHGSRKWVRYLGFILPELKVRGPTPALDGALVRELGQLLGELHDVHQLIGFARQHEGRFPSREEAGYLLHHLRAQEARLQGRCQQLAHKALPFTPRQLEKRLCGKG